MKGEKLSDEFNLEFWLQNNETQEKKNYTVNHLMLPTYLIYSLEIKRSSILRR
jgi:hypothetical protein